MNDQVLNIKKLDLDTIDPVACRDPNKPDTFCQGAVYLIIGMSGSGKSSIIKDIIFHKRHFIPITVAISESELANSSYSKHIPPLFVYEEFDNTIIGKIIARQTLALRNPETKNPWLTLVLDDCMNTNSNMNDQNSIRLFKMSRHFCMLNLISCQYSVDLKAFARGQSAGYFLLRCDNENDREKLYNLVASVIPSRALFNQLMDTITPNYGALFINNRCTSGNWQDKVSWYSGSDLSEHENWSAVSSIVREYNDARYDKNYDPMADIINSVAH